MRADFRMMKDVAAHTRVEPKIRVEELQQFAQKVNRDEETAKLLKDWSIILADQPLRVEGIQLAAPTLHYRNKPINKSADWSRDMRDGQLVEAKDLNDRCWMILHTGSHRGLANELAGNLRKVGGGAGIRVEEPLFIALRDDHTESFLDEIKRNVVREGSGATTMIVCILPTPKKDRYDAIKHLCCHELGIPSQCVVAKTLERSNLSVATKISQQMNCKMGGQLWAINDVPPSSMVIGIDVNHDTSRAHGRRSVAGFCASTNDLFTKYYSETSFQGVGQELVDGLKSFMSRALQEYNRVNSTLPAWIFIFRDGVGDGMLPAVLEHEVTQITAVCDAIYAQTPIVPKYCFIVVKKRIHTRLFATQGTSIDNPPPGTVLSTHAVTGDKDFFLVSQSVNQGKPDQPLLPPFSTHSGYQEL